MAFRFPCSGRPDDDPAVTAGTGSQATLCASWNGATEFAVWQVLAGPNPDELEAVASAPRKGFETGMTVDVGEAYVGVRAKNSSGRVPGTRKVVEPGD